MMNKYTIIACLWWGVVFSQDPLQGVIQFQENNNIYPLTGANAFWQNTTVGTVTDSEGAFLLERVPSTNILIISYLGFKTDTLKIESSFISHRMIQSEEDELKEVVLSQRKKTLQKSFIETQNILKVTEDLAAPDCSWLLLAAPGCYWLFLNASDCFWLFLTAPDCF